MPRLSLLAGLILTMASAARADEAGSNAGQKHALQYKFKAGETLHWEVSHRAKIRTTAGGSSQVVETISDSVKVWQVSDVNAQGQMTFVHSVARVTLRHRTSGREETVVELPLPPGKPAPFGYEQAASDVGIPLTRVTIDGAGKIIKRDDLRQRKRPSTSGYEGPMTIPLPSEPVAVGERWTNEHVVSAPRQDGTFKQVRLEQRFTLKSVKNQIATIFVESVLLSPVREPEIKVHLVQSKTRGTLKFDMAAGRVIEQDLSLDEEIIGFPLGDASSMHYVMTFTEKFSKEPPQAAQRASQKRPAR
jgi:hypothetical protein